MTENLTNKEFNQKRHRFLLGILAITLLFITYVVYAGTALHRQALKISQNRLILLASQLEKHTKNYFSNYISLFESISELSTVRLKDTVALNAFFNRLNRRFTEFENIAAVDENGFFFASGRPFDLNNPPNVSKLPFFQDARRGDAVIIMEPHIGPISHQHVTGVLVRLEDQNQRFKGVIGASTKLFHLTNIWAQFAEDKNLKLFCFRENHEILFRAGIDKSTCKTFLSGSNTKKHFEIDNRQYLFSKIHLDEVKLNIVFLSEKSFPGFYLFITTPVNIAVSIIFLCLIGLSISMYRKEEQYRQTVESAIDGFWITDTKGRFLQVNYAYCQMIGFSSEELLGMSIRDVEAIESVEESEEHIQDVIKSGNDKFETKHQCKNGNIIDLEVSTTYTKNRGGMFFVFLRDITERKQAEEALRESESLFSQMFEQSTTSMCLYKPVGTIYRVNSEFCKMFGVEEHVIIDAGYNVLKDQAIIDCGVAPALRELFDEKKTQSWELNFDIDTASESTGTPTSKTGKIFLEVYGYPVLNHHGDLEYVVLQHYDITKRKELEANLQQAHKMESIGTMAGGVAHDFNNILSIIIGNSELALDDIPDWNPAHLNIEQIKDSSLRAAGIVKQLLSLSRQTDQELSPIGIKAVIKDSLRFLRSTIPTTVKIREDIMATEETILADSVQINQVIMNLCINASQAMEETGGILDIRVEKKSLSEKSADNDPDLPPGDYIKIEVSDSGSGIAPEIIGRIFDPYFTTKDVGKGSGMGLSVVHGIVTSHNGDIAVDSQLGRGSTFTILFPVITQKPAMKVKSPDEVRGGNEKILFVDDEQAVTFMSGQILERFGYEVTTETNPTAALDLFQLKPDEFDLVITDMTMPQMTGVTLSERLKEIRPDIPVIISTGYSSLIDKESAQEKGIAAYVMKPIVKRDLARTIRAVLAKKQEK